MRTRATLGALALFVLSSCTREVRPIRPAADYETEETIEPIPRQRVVVPPSIEPAVPLDEETVEPPPNPATAPLSRRLPELESFYAAIDRVRSGARESKVRVLWLGDSHTAADFMTHPVREHLASLASDGGPGFVRLGMDGYRHGAVKFSESGKWRKAPILPSQRTRVLDGVFGYGGIRNLPAAGASVTAELREPRDVPFRWTLSYRLPPGAQLSVRWGQRSYRISKSGVEDLSGKTEGVVVSESTTGEILSATFDGAPNEAFTVGHVGGDPQIFGAFGEYADGGVILDTVGINGARAATVLAWEPQQYVDQLRQRSLDLLVLAFGTNEVFDQTNPQRYEEHMRDIVHLARTARPDLPCWIVGPPDSAAQGGGSKERVHQVTEVQRAAAAMLGCAFTSAFELMGGEGSFAAWARERPARARSDRIHLTIAGYESLGASLAQSLIVADEVVSPTSESTAPSGME